MKKIFVILAILGISMWGVSELNAALFHQMIAPEGGNCARATEECPEKPGYYKVVCKDGGAGTICSYPENCPYDLNLTDCEDPPPQN